MAQPYSYDLHAKVIKAIEMDGLKKCEASELFNISRNTIHLWLKRKAQTGEFTPLLSLSEQPIYESFISQSIQAFLLEKNRSCICY